MALALADAVCSNQVNTNGVFCKCVLAGKICDFQGSSSGSNIYEWRKPGSPLMDAITTTNVTTILTTAATTRTFTTTTHELIEELRLAPRPTRARENIDPNSLFCFMLVVPWGDEPEIVKWQKDAEKGIFACDRYAVYSNTSDINGLSGVRIQVVQTDLHCELGGKWHTRLNTPIFIKLWEQVVRDGQYKTTAWTVKLDPDSVFFPERLRDVIASPSHRAAQESNGLFADNCEYRHSLHGPIELLSRRALETYAVGHAEICSQPPQEDVYLRLCLLKLGVRLVQDYTLLAEEYCYWDWESCKSSRVTFHPFKTLQSQWDCYFNAEKYGKWFILPKSLK
jgi:hypothetical protein